MFGPNDVDWLLNKLPLPTSVSTRLKKFWKDEDKPSRQKKLIVNSIKYSFIFKALFWAAMSVHLIFNYYVSVGTEDSFLPFGDGMTVEVVARNQPRRLEACLKSLEEADYGTDSVRLSIVVLSSGGIFSSYDEETLKVARNSLWTHGEKRVLQVHRSRVNSLGLLPDTFHQNHTLGETLYLSEDTVVSPRYYKWIREQRYTYGKVAAESQIAGVTIESILIPTEIDPGTLRTGKGKLSNAFAFDFLPEVSCFLPDAHVWREFGLWLDQHQSIWMSRPVVPKSFESQRGLMGSSKNHWTRWFSEFLQENNYFVVYPNLDDMQAISLVGNPTLRRNKVILSSELGFANLVDRRTEFNFSPLKYFSVNGRSKSMESPHVELEAITKASTSSKVVLVSVGSEEESVMAGSWICSLAAMNEPNLPIFMITSVSGSLGASLAEAGSSSLHIFLRQKLQSREREMCATATTLLRLGNPVIFGDVHQVWNRLPQVPDVDDQKDYDVAVAVEPSGQAKGTFAMFMPTLRARLFMNHACTVHAKENSHRFQDTLATLLTEDVLRENRLTMKNLISEVRSVSSFLNDPSTADSGWQALSVIDDVPRLDGDTPLPKSLLRWDQRSGKCVEATS
eukprot:CAMPEP_0113969742 /NCGR_PEP_ID=MMETSP0011_2-20120614/10560_1 /TAXON_ID=101924 /ORGANISM="Rhodosorus marinus" /LENGTH=620 /DNA_ID=CAMNT_0000983581 /DNA_START=94 /DNA_END=1956 /DNA_ORIENTATION=- /assembly_acc=CAM_ASM_000156